MFEVISFYPFIILFLFSSRPTENNFYYESVYELEITHRVAGMQANGLSINLRVISNHLSVITIISK